MRPWRSKLIANETVLGASDVRCLLESLLCESILGVWGARESMQLMTQLKRVFYVPTQVVRGLVCACLCLRTRVRLFKAFVLARRHHGDRSIVLWIFNQSARFSVRKKTFFLWKIKRGKISNFLFVEKSLEKLLRTSIIIEINACECVCVCVWPTSTGFIFVPSRSVSS